jgi:hypothetical protein
MAMGSVGEHHWRGAFQVLQELTATLEPNQLPGSGMWLEHVGTKLERRGLMDYNDFPMVIHNLWFQHYGYPQFMD